MRLRRALLGVSLLLCTLARGQAPVDLQLYAAGSLRAAMTEIAQPFSAAGGPRVQATFGASGLLRERIEKGEPAAVFASADIGNPRALAQAGRAAAPVVFARNRLCALVAAGVEAASDTLLDRLLDPAIKLGTSTPKADPAGDYAWQLFAKAERLRPGAFDTLDAKALQLTGGPGSPAPPADRSVYGAMVAEHRADIFLTYCTNAMQAVREVPGARSIAPPESLAVGAEYALTTINGAPPHAARLAAFILSPQGQEILARHGFAPGVNP
jgi:ABC-type molybdate transport system substrate-binding protein